MRYITYSICLGVLLLGFSSCLKDKQELQSYSYTDDEFAVLAQYFDLPNPVFDYGNSQDLFFHERPVFNSHFEIENNRLNHLATLGRVLFYEDKISKNNTVSCASCHLQERAFADPQPLSEGFDGKLTLRNSLSLGNLRGYSNSRFFWDERAGSVHEQTMMTMQDDIEMGADLAELPGKLDTEAYRILFRKAFGSEEINSHLIATALESFVNSLNSNNSHFDRAMMDHGMNTWNDFSSFSSRENEGKSLYQNNCASCHGSNPAFPARNIANNGLDLLYSDVGVGAITHNTADNGKFKVPILRNIALTAPYMHDGRFATLEEVIDHYSTGINNHPNLDPELLDWNGPKRFNFTDSEKEALVAFLNTLTDNEFVNDIRFADPTL